MIDTIILIIPITREHILDVRAFNPSAELVLGFSQGVMTKGNLNCKQNPNTEDKNNKNYKPRLTLSKRLRKEGFSIALKIEFSVPKILYGNNFEELEENDYFDLITKLQKKLLEMKVRVSTNEIENAMVTGVHYGKNIILTTFPASFFIKIISKMDISKRFDLGQTDFINEGQAIRFHNNNFEFSIYDKIKEIQQSRISEKRSCEKDSYIQKNLFSKKEECLLEVLRLEIRMNNRKVIKHNFAKIGVDSSNMRLIDFFNKTFAKNLLLELWKSIIYDNINVIFSSENEPLTLFYKLINQGFSKTRSKAILGALAIIKENGIRAYKDIDKSYYRLKIDIEKLQENLKENILYKNFREVEKTISKMESVRLEDYKGMVYM